MDKVINIHKAGGVLIKDRKFLVTREKDHEFFVAPGGTLNYGEDPKEAVIRELFEELQIAVTENDLASFGTFFAQASGEEEKFLQMDVFMVNQWSGEIKLDNEVEELMWIDSNPPKDLKIGSIFQHDVLPKLKEMNLID